MTTLEGNDEPATAPRGAGGHADAMHDRDAAVTLNVAGPGVAASIIRLTNALSMRLEEDVKTSSTSGSRALAAALKQQYDYLCAQVALAEEQIHARLTGTLSFNGLLFVALALLAGSSASVAKGAEAVVPWIVGFLLGALPFAGLSITLCGWVGVRRAIGQRMDLRRQYAQNVESLAHENGWPAPFENSHTHWHGTFPLQLSLAVLCGLWAWHQVWPGATESFSNMFLHGLGARIFGGA